MTPRSLIPYRYHHIDEVFQDGSMITNCWDHYAVVKALIKGRFISDFSIQQNLLNESQTNRPETTYNAGMYKEKNRYYHGGSWIGHHSFFSYNQSNEEFIFLYSQRLSTKKLKKIEEEIRLSLSR